MTGLFRDIPPVPNGTMVRDGHLGSNPSCWYNGIIPGFPTCTKQYNGTGQTLGIKPLWLVQWDYPRMSHLYQTVQWGWTLGIQPLWLVQWNYLRMSHLYQTVQWYGMDTWDLASLVGTMELSQDTSPVPMVH